MYRSLCVSVRAINRRRPYDRRGLSLSPVACRRVTPCAVPRCRSEAVTVGPSIFINFLRTRAETLLAFFIDFLATRAEALSATEQATLRENSWRSKKIQRKFLTVEEDPEKIPDRRRLTEYSWWKKDSEKSLTVEEDPRGKIMSEERLENIPYGWKRLKENAWRRRTSKENSWRKKSLRKHQTEDGSDELPVWWIRQPSLEPQCNPRQSVPLDHIESPCISFFSPIVIK